MLFCNSFPSTCARQTNIAANIQISPLASGLTFSEPGNHKTRKTHEPGIAGNESTGKTTQHGTWFQKEHGQMISIHSYFSTTSLPVFSHLLYLHMGYFFLLPEEAEFIRIKPSQVTESMDALNDGINAGARCRIPKSPWIYFIID